MAPATGFLRAAPDAGLFVALSAQDGRATAGGAEA
jgi:hypothetical protein